MKINVSHPILKSHPILAAFIIVVALIFDLVQTVIVLLLGAVFCVVAVPVVALLFTIEWACGKIGKGP